MGLVMANMRIIYNNVTDLASTITATTTASGFSTDNLKTNQKTSVHRNTGTSGVTYTVNWSTDQIINSVALPATNLISGATIRIKLYNSTNTLLVDTDILQACTDRNVLLQTGSTTPSYTDFIFGGATKTSIWLSQDYTTVRKMEVILVNGSNTVDCSRIVCGKYWESTRQVEKGITLGSNDNSEIITTRSGNTYIDRRAITEVMNFNLAYINNTDRATLLNIFRTWGISGFMYICVFPDNSNPEITQAYSIYGRNQANSLSYAVHNLYNTALDIIGW